MDPLEDYDPFEDHLREMEDDDAFIIPIAYVAAALSLWAIGLPLVVAASMLDGIPQAIAVGASAAAVATAVALVKYS